MARELEKVELTNMCMVYKGNQVLVQNRIKSWKGLAFPGGHVEAGESVVDSTRREIKEETGLAIEKLQMCGIKQWFTSEGVRNIVFLYKTNCFHGKLQSNDEGENFWISMDELLERKDEFANNFEYMLEVFTNDNISEHFHVHLGDDILDILK